MTGAAVGAHRVEIAAGRPAAGHEDRVRVAAHLDLAAERRQRAAARREDAPPAAPRPPRLSAPSRRITAPRAPGRSSSRAARPPPRPSPARRAPGAAVDVAVRLDVAPEARGRTPSRPPVGAAGGSRPRSRVQRPCAFGAAAATPCRVPEPRQVRRRRGRRPLGRRARPRSPRCPATGPPSPAPPRRSPTPPACTRASSYSTTDAPGRPAGGSGDGHVREPGYGNGPRQPLRKSTISPARRNAPPAAAAESSGERPERHRRAGRRRSSRAAASSPRSDPTATASASSGTGVSSR